MIRRLQSNNFRPPADTTKPLILIGPGTGVAPFIGFLQHRHARQEMNKKVEEDTCTGCWRGGFEIEEDCKTSSQQFGEIHLFFGCRHEKKDFLYREEMSRYLDSGILTKLYTAFSRDQKEKIYVTNRIREHGKKLAEMILSQDACVYVCGDGAKMAKDVRYVRARSARIFIASLTHSYHKNTTRRRRTFSKITTLEHHTRTSQVQSALSDVLLSHSSEMKDMDEVSSYVDTMIRRGRYLADVW
jgi:sulfite reductase alpha subunit-like flavoprotein